MRRLTVMVTLTASERVAQQCIVVSHIHRAIKAFKAYLVVPDDLTSLTICERGMVTSGASRSL